MNQIVRYPLLVFALGLAALWRSAQIGRYFRKRRRDPEEAEREDFGVVVAATLTLLALIIGFTASALGQFAARAVTASSNAPRTVFGTAL